MILLGRKIGMSRVIDPESGKVVPVTGVYVDENEVTAVRTEEKEGYNNVEVGTKWNKRKATKGMAMRSGKIGKDEEYKVGDKVSLQNMLDQEVEKVQVIAVSKGKGFAGVMKRHNFAGFPRTHGHQYHRTQGSTGMCVAPGRTIKGKKMAGHMGVDKCTLRDRQVIKIDPQNKVILIKGPIPGAMNGLVQLHA